jgi:glutamine synthetase
MSLSPRQSIVEKVNSRTIRKFPLNQSNGMGTPEPIRNIFGMNRFGMNELKQALTSKIFESLNTTLQSGKPVETETSKAIASVVKQWALKKGVTHYCHWFQPQTGSTAEKHDSILTLDDKGLPIEEFSYKQLIQSEPDASSFPSGGMRSTFEARGYTAWDPTSPMFIIDTENGRTLSIPSVFVSYTGEALDKKTPLLRSMRAIDFASQGLMTALGQDAGITSILPTVGPEQEYFLIDKAFYYNRPDLILCGRVFGGQPSTRGQNLDDHYFGQIPSRIQAFMQEVEYELYKIGVLAKTRHNEVAPAQYELAVLHQDANVAADHNQMVMNTLAKVASRHNFKLLLHEKPFEGINGNGKHVNWSLRTNTGTNLLNPGDNKEESLRFLCVLASILTGVSEYSGLIRASIGSLGNDRRLGGNEAPPAIVSVFVGATIRSIFSEIRKKNFTVASKTQEFIKLGLKNIPEVFKDNTDRNRTSPLAFTGDKFEYRSVGGSATISWPVTVINTVVAEGLLKFTEQLNNKISKEKDLETAIFQTLHETLQNTEHVLFEGNNYASDWVTEAQKRKLPNYASCADAYSEYWKKETEMLFAKHHVLSHRELESRATVLSERYVKGSIIECWTLINMVRQHIVPSIENQLCLHAHALESINTIGATQKPHIQKVAKALTLELDELLNLVEALDKTLIAEPETENMLKLLAWVRTECFPIQMQLEAKLGVLEAQVSDELWPLPKVFEMLHIH